MIIRLLDRLGIVKGVYLEDCWGGVYETVANRKHPFRDAYTAHVYAFTGIGDVILNADGSTGGGSCYIRRWKWMRERGEA